MAQGVGAPRDLQPVTVPSTWLPRKWWSSDGAAWRRPVNLNVVLARRECDLVERGTRTFTRSAPCRAALMEGCRRRASRIAAPPLVVLKRESRADRL